MEKTGPDVAGHLARAAVLAAEEMIRRCEVLIVAGTSSLVSPASGYAAAAKRHGARVIEVNPDETPVSGLCDATFRGRSDEGLSVSSAGYPTSL